VAQAVAFVVDDFIQEGLVFYAGQQGVGKTSGLLPLVMAAAGLHEPGYELAPKRPDRWRHVIYITEDHQQAERIIFAMVAQGHFTLEQVEQRMHIIPAVSMSAVDFVAVAEEYATLTSSESGVPLLPLVVADTRSALFHLESENDNAQMSELISQLKQNFGGLPLWVIAHLAKAEATRTNAQTMSVRGAGSAEGDAHQVLFLVREDAGGSTTRWLVRGKTRFDASWSELELLSRTEALEARDRWGEMVTTRVSWGVATPPARPRAEIAAQAKEAAREAEAASLRDEIAVRVDEAWLSGEPLNREAVKSQIGGKREKTVAAIDDLIANGRLAEVEVPKADRIHPNRKSYLVLLSYQERLAWQRTGQLPAHKTVVPASWKRPLTAVPDVERKNDQECGF
jgi:RecA-family ATPase